MSTIKAPTFDECYLRVRLLYRDRGIALSIRRSYQSGRRVDIICDRGRRYSSKSQVRKTSSKVCDCPFAGKIRFLPETNEWIWEVLAGRDSHNHDPVLEGNFESVPAFRTLSQAEAEFRKTSSDIETNKPSIIDRVEQLSKARIKSRDIASQIREQENVIITAYDVRNIQQKLRHEKYGPLSSTSEFAGGATVWL
ncbi:uncharacterized protein CTRU02_212087 [Colletotrichum truncatum]|uniref:Uncharacterized protein n=1 Tax=Colletotrichum truncatum TaxID=5467 RepID=A0ACC3YMJ7_COLTU|nr:uncharacterized protein CTRU02_06842 [Colletotrichum truncatum]KAF6792225.1 hypothetical protein CTRU02_06842 [Colletotrichum truncatum]